MVQDGFREKLIEFFIKQYGRVSFILPPTSSERFRYSRTFVEKFEKTKVLYKVKNFGLILTFSENVPKDRNSSLLVGRQNFTDSFIFLNKKGHSKNMGTYSLLFRRWKYKVIIFQKPAKKSMKSVSRRFSSMSKTVQVLFKNDEKNAPPPSSEIDCRILENGVTEALLQVNLIQRFILTPTLSGFKGSNK